MSKSLGNFVTIADVLSNLPGEVVRLNMLRTHYRQPIDWTESNLAETMNILVALHVPDHIEPTKVSDVFLEALTDDLNISKALAEMYALKRAKKLPELKACFELLGVIYDPPRRAANNPPGEDFVPGPFNVVAGKDQIIRLIENRLAARHLKNWAESDRIRDELDTMGIAIKDNKDGTTTWEVKR